MKTSKTFHNFVCWVGIWSLLSMIPIFGIIVTTMAIQNTTREGDEFYIQPALLERMQDYAVKAGWLSIAGFVGSVLLVDKTAKAIRKAEAEAELQESFNHRYQYQQQRHRDSSHTQRVQHRFSQENTRQLLGDFQENLYPGKPAQPLACKGCKYYDGSSYGGNPLICGIHPYGPGDESDPSQQPTTCQDWEGDKPLESDVS